MAGRQDRPYRRALLVRVSTILTAIVLVLMSYGLCGLAAASPTDPIPPKKYNYGFGFGADDPGDSGGSHPADSGSDQGSGTTSAGRHHDTSGPSYTPNQCGGFRFGVQPCDFTRGAAMAPAQPRRAPTVTPAQLAARQWRQLPIPAPEVRTAPPRGSDGLVGLAEWFWVTNWSPQSARAQAGGVWAEVSAQPASLTIHPGRGLSSVTCDGPGTPYDPKLPAAAQRSDCTYTYARSSAGLPRSAYMATVTVTWGGTWSGSGGEGGTLPELTRSTSIPIRIAEGQALTGG